MKKKRFAALFFGACLITSISAALLIGLRSGALDIGNHQKDYYANYAIYVASGGKLPYLEWKEKENANYKKGEKGDPGVYPVATKITRDGHLILVLSNGEEIDAGVMPVEVD